MVAAPGDVAAARLACGPGVEVVAVPIDDSWIRDSGPIGVVGPRGERAVVDFAFNGWGEKFPPWDQDDALAGRLAEHLDLPRYRAPFVLEGGAIAVDGEGTLITTEQCLLHPNRNPELTRAQIEAGLRDYLGVERVIWIPFGLADDDDTDGHVDNVACFVAPGVVLVQGCDDRSRPDHERLAINRRCLAGATDAAGRSLEVIDVPVLPFVDTGRGARAVPYLNAYVANGVVVVPVAGHPADERMLDVARRVLPGPRGGGRRRRDAGPRRRRGALHHPAGTVGHTPSRLSPCSCCPPPGRPRTRPPAWSRRTGPSCASAPCSTAGIPTRPSTAGRCGRASCWPPARAPR